MTARTPGVWRWPRILRSADDPKIEFLATDQHLLEQYPILPASQALPAWFKAMPSPATRLRSDANAKSCPGLIDYLSIGYMVPLWSDYIVRVDAERNTYVQGTWEGAFDFFTEKHTAGMVPGTEATKTSVKLTAPWAIRTAPGWSILCLPPLYSPIEGIQILAGVVATDVMHHFDVIINPMFIDASKLIPAGTPICHIIPYRRQRATAESKRVSDDEMSYLQASGKGGILGGRRLLASGYRQSLRKVNPAGQTPPRQTWRSKWRRPF